MGGKREIDRPAGSPLFERVGAGRAVQAFRQPVRWRRERRSHQRLRFGSRRLAPRGQSSYEPSGPTERSAREESVSVEPGQHCSAPEADRERCSWDSRRRVPRSAPARPPTTWAHVGGKPARPAAPPCRPDLRASDSSSSRHLPPFPTLPSSPSSTTSSLVRPHPHVARPAPGRGASHALADDPLDAARACPLQPGRALPLRPAPEPTARRPHPSGRRLWPHQRPRRRGRQRGQETQCRSGQLCARGGCRGRRRRDGGRAVSRLRKALPHAQLGASAAVLRLDD